MTTKPDRATAFQNASEEITLEEIFRRIDEAGPDPDRPSLEEISQIVKEGRKITAKHRHQPPSLDLNG